MYFPDPVSEKKVVKESSAASSYRNESSRSTSGFFGTWYSAGMDPSGWIPCSRQYSSLVRGNKMTKEPATGWHILQQGGTYCNRVAHPPAGVAHLDACLADVDGDHLSHGDQVSLLLSNEHKSQVVLIQWKSPWPTAMSRKSCLVWECARTMWRRTGFRHSRQGVKEGTGKVGKPWGTRFSTNQPPPRMPSCLVHYCIKCYFLIALTFKLSL